MTHMTYAAIDIGTNTFRLLIADVSEKDGNGRISFSEIHSERVITRLGEGISRNGLLTEKSMERGIHAMEQFSGLIAEHRAGHVLAIATSALRNARNSDEFITRVKNSTGIEIEVISGDKEAELTADGMLIDIDRPSSSLMVDIGGGSTEMIFKKTESPLYIQSLDLGVVYLAETYMKEDPPSREDLELLGQHIMGTLEPVRGTFARMIGPDTVLMGTAGTVTALAAALQHLETYDHGKVHNYRMKVSDIENIYSAMTQMTTEERSKLLPFEPSRLDIIVPGTLILLKVMAVFGFSEMIVSNYGLREGILTECYSRSHRSH